MLRTAFEKVSLDEGFRSQRIESIAVYSQGYKMLVGSTEGALYSYECQTTPSSNSKIQCKLASTVRNQPKDRKPVSSLTVLEGWLIIVGIIDGVISVLDLNTLVFRSTLPDTKGCHLFTINEKNYTMIVANKKKLSIYTWSPGHNSQFMLKKEIATPDLAKTIICTENGIVVGYKRSYEYIDLNSFNTVKILDIDRDQRMVCLEMPATPLRPATILVSQGLQGVVFDLLKISASVPSVNLLALAGSDKASSAAASVVSERTGSAMLTERLEWNSAPVSIQIISPFILSIISDSVEVHDMITLSSLQRITLPTIAPSSTFSTSASISYSYSGCVINPAAGIEYGYVCNGDQVVVLRMVPLKSQVMVMLDSGRYEDVINLCTLCASNPQIRDIEIADINFKYGMSLYHKGDFEGAISNFISAETAPFTVLELFPDLVPAIFHAAIGINSSGKAPDGSNRNSLPRSGGAALPLTTPKMSGLVFHRAAGALAQFCDHHRIQLRLKVEMAERAKANQANANSSGNISGGSISKGAAAKYSGDLDDPSVDPDSILRTAEIIDTVLLQCLLSCSPPRKAAVLDLLSSHQAATVSSNSGSLLTSSSSYPNRCHLESSSVLLASQGNAFTEALLWLYRSHNEHRRVLGALNEDRCVGAGAWTKEQFYSWTAEYLRWLWFSEDISLPMLALNALKPVFEADADLGFSVLTVKPRGMKSTSSGNNNSSAPGSGGNTTNNANILGGKGVTVQDILAFLETLTPKSALKESKPATGTTVNSVFNQHFGSKKDISSSSKVSGTVNQTGPAANLKVPLVNGRAFCIAYLEWLVKSGSAPAYLHDEYARFLIEGIPASAESDKNTSVELIVRDGDAESVILYKIYRGKLQYFLQTSREYHAEKVLKILPANFLIEYSLVLSKMSKHDEVLKIYINQLHDLALAEQYCDRVYRQSHEDLVNSAKRGVESYMSSGDGVYIVMIKVLLSESTSLKVSHLDDIVTLCENYYDRIDTLELLSVIPKKVPLAKLSKYLMKVIENANSKKRNLQVIHQLLRSREVNLRTSDFEG